MALFNDQNVQPTNGQSRYIVETITMTTVTERRIVREAANDQLKMVGDMSMMNDRSGVGADKYNSAAAAAAAAGILKGGKLWRNQDTNTSSASEAAGKRTVDIEKDQDDKRSVKFHRDENHQLADNCDSTRPVGENDKEFMLTFKLGNRVVPCNSLKPNSAVRQLFPDPRFVNPPSILDLEDDNLGKCEGKYLVTEESLRAFNEVNKRSVFAISGKERYPYKDGNFTVHSDDEDIPQNDLIKKTIERNTLRRSLMRYPRGAGGERKREKKKRIEPSLEERIKQLTCVDDQDDQAGSGQYLHQDHYRSDEPIPPRTSPPGEESHDAPCKVEKASSVSSTYKKFTDLFARNKAAAAAVAAGDNQNEHYPYYQPVYHAMSSVPAQPDLGMDYKLQTGPLMVSKQAASAKMAGAQGSSNEARKQFLSSLAPLTACVTGHMEPTTYGDRDTLKLKLAGDRHSITSTASTGTEYSVGDIDEALGKPEDLAGGKAPQPDVVAGTPSGQDSQDELAMFVQQDAGRIERIKKRYSNTPSTVSDDDEHDDYGFSRRPSVRGIKPRFGSTNEILQQMQAQLQQPSVVPSKPGSHMTWPYYSAECGIVDKNGPAGATSPRNALPALKEESGDGSKTEYTAKMVWEKCSATGTIPRGGTVAGLQQPLKIDANNVQMFRLTPSDTITEVAVPYKCDPADPKDLRRFPAGNVFQMKVSPVTATQVRLPMGVPDGASGQFTAHPIPVGTTSVIRVGHGQQQTFRVPCPVSGPVQVHLLATHPYENAQIRSSSQPIHFPPQIVVAKGTQTSTISTTSFYQLQTNTQSHYQNTSSIPVTKAAASEHTTKLIQVNYNTASPPISSLTSSPTRAKNQNHMIERGIPEGAVSSSPAFIQDCVKPSQNSPMQLTDAQNSAQNQSQAKSASLMYGMKV